MILGIKRDLESQRCPGLFAFLGLKEASDVTVRFKQLPARCSTGITEELEGAPGQSPF